MLEEAVDDGDARHAVAPSSKQYGRADRAIDANSARASSWLIFGDLVEDRLPRLLLLVNERRGFGG